MNKFSKKKISPVQTSNSEIIVSITLEEWAI
jgi:hypothetical protein